VERFPGVAVEGQVDEVATLAAGLAAAKQTELFGSRPWLEHLMVEASRTAELGAVAVAHASSWREETWVLQIGASDTSSS